MNKIYLAGGSSYMLPSVKTTNPHYESKVVAPSKIIWLNSIERSKDVPPANHKAWRDLNNLFAEVNTLPVDEYDDSWLRDLRLGSSERINRFYESEDW